MNHLLLNGLIALAFLLLCCGMVLSVRWAKRNREAAGAWLAVAMLFGVNWVMPPPKPETEDLDSERDEDSGEGEPD
jgi:hypothetical protein